MESKEYFEKVMQDYAVGSLNLMPVCIASSLIISITLQISFNLQQKLRGYNIGL